MALKFNIRKEKIVTDANFYLFEEFVDIWKHDRDVNKRAAHKMLYFIFLLCDLSEDNPLRDVAAEHKEKEALFRVYGAKEHKFTKKERELLQRGVDTYIKYSKTAEERILELFDVKAEELRLVLENTKPETIENERDGVTTFVTNTGIITKGLKELDFVKKQKINVISAIRNEAMTQKVRGKIILSPLSKGNITIPAEHELYEINTISGESESRPEEPED